MVHDEPGIDDKFRVPRGNNDHELVGAGRAAAVDAVLFKSQLIAHEMSSEFLEDLAPVIAAWLSASHTARAPRRKKGTEESTDTTGTSGTTAAQVPAELRDRRRLRRLIAAIQRNTRRTSRTGIPACPLRGDMMLQG
ncbi:MAG TPA: hypothetical protein VNO50_18265 [Pyrinomonadaceae bacterium]|nr:hypothetical protein [Pyrinomonadaceae bacterium]